MHSTFKQNPAQRMVRSARCFCMLLAAILMLAERPAFAEPIGSELDVPLTELWTGDFDGMTERRSVRALLPLSQMFLYYDRGELRGLSADTLRAFQDHINRGRPRIEHITVYFIPTPRDRLFEDLVAGKGDIAVGNLTVTSERQKNIDFSKPFLTNVSELVVTRPEHRKIQTLDDLAGLSIHVRRSSSYFESLQQINADFTGRGLTPIQIGETDPWLEDEDLLEMLAAGLINATVIDSHKFETWGMVYSDLVAHRSAPVRKGGEIAWAMRKDSPKLAEIVNSFVSTSRKGTERGNIALRTYIGNVKWLARARQPENVATLKRLAVYFERYGTQYGLDPNLLAAVAFQESRFNPKARSSAGARGVMQMLPSTARDPNVGLPDVNDPETSVHAFARYFSFLRENYLDQPELSEHDRMMMTLASYNAGPGRIRSLRRKASDPNVWKDSVEWEVWKEVGFETVNYVRQIQKYYVAFRDMSAGMKLRSR